MRLKPLFFIMLCLTASVTWAEEIILPIGQQGGENKTIERPKLGSSKESVLNQFGEPLNRQAAVGEPPISAWEYEHYTVYFEYDHVLHSVLKPVGVQKVAP